MNVNITRLTDKFESISLPEYKTGGSAGMDIYAALEETVIIKPGAVALIPTNLAFELPEGYECQVRSRSGLAVKNGVFCLNSPGTIDSDYRGEVKVILANFGKEDFEVKCGDRIAQLVISKYEKINWNVVEQLDDTGRGAGGFGSTGK